VEGESTTRVSPVAKFMSPPHIQAFTDATNRFVVIKADEANLSEVVEDSAPLLSFGVEAD